MTFEVTVSRTGTVTVTADTASRAMALAEIVPSSEIDWDDDFLATDAREIDS